MQKIVDIISTTNNIKICDSIFEIIYKYIQLNYDSKESGGILIGKENESNSNLIIKYVTEPYLCDVRKRNRFKRIDKRHIEEFYKIYDASSGIYRYVGEWHTHNEKTPNFSSTDLKGWNKIMKECPCYNEFYHLILGNKNSRIWKCIRGIKEPILIKTILNKGVCEHK